MKALRVLAALAALALPAFGDAKETHTGVVRSSRLLVRFRPDSMSAATAESVLAAAERDLDRIAKALEVKPIGPFTLWLYDDLSELSAISGTDGNGGYTVGRDSHVPIGNDQTRVHELVHAVASELPKGGDEPRNFLFEEGLANAVLEHVHGVHVHAVAAFYLKRDKLPPLADLTGGDFYKWQFAHPNFNAYDVGASYVRFLMDRYGVPKTVKYVRGAPAKTAFGAPPEDVQKAWLEFVGKYPLRAETETLLAQRDGEGVGFEPYVKGLPPDIAGKPGDWVPLLAAKMKLDDLTKWNREDGVLKGTNADPAWSFCELGDETWGDCAIRAVIKTTDFCALGVRLSDSNKALLVNGTFIYRGADPVAHSPKAEMTPMRRDTDFVVVRRGEEMEIWIDGVKVLTGPAVRGNARVGVGVALGAATFTDVRARKLAPR
jgi:hypothetical protein